MEHPFVCVLAAVGPFVLRVQPYSLCSFGTVLVLCSLSLVRRVSPCLPLALVQASGSCFIWLDCMESCGERSTRTFICLVPFGVKYL